MRLELLLYRSSLIDRFSNGRREKYVNEKVPESEG